MVSSSQSDHHEVVVKVAANSKFRICLFYLTSLPTPS